jgi:hypothetical protein
MPAGKSVKAGPLIEREDTAETDVDDDLLNRIAAINRALQSWNDQEALRLLRLHWRQIARFVRERA